MGLVRHVRSQGSRAEVANQNLRSHQAGSLRIICVSYILTLLFQPCEELLRLGFHTLYAVLRLLVSTVNDPANSAYVI